MKRTDQVFIPLLLSLLLLSTGFVELKPGQGLDVVLYPLNFIQIKNGKHFLALVAFRFKHM